MNGFMTVMQSEATDEQLAGGTRGLPPTSQVDKSSAAICRERGWNVGTLIVSMADRGEPRWLRITAVGEKNILAYQPLAGVTTEQCYCLWQRDWREPTQAELKRLSEQLEGK